MMMLGRSQPKLGRWRIAVARIKHRNPNPRTPTFSLMHPEGKIRQYNLVSKEIDPPPRREQSKQAARIA